MNDLNFYITVYDDRKELNTWQQNEFAHQKKLIEYENIQALIPENDNQFVVIMTFGYRTDGLVLRQFIKQKYKYLGLLGSKKETSTNNKKSKKKSSRRRCYELQNSRLPIAIWSPYL